MRINPYIVSVVVFSFMPAYLSAAPIHRLAKKGDLPGVEEELAKWVHVNEVDQRGRTALHWAAENGHLHVIRVLLDHGANVDIVDAHGTTAIDLAERRGFENVARALRGELEDNTDTPEETPDSYEGVVAGNVFFRFGPEIVPENVVPSEEPTDESSFEESAADIGFSPRTERALNFAEQLGSRGF